MSRLIRLPATLKARNWPSGEKPTGTLDVVQRADVGMVQGGDDLRFALYSGAQRHAGLAPMCHQTILMRSRVRTRPPGSGRTDRKRSTERSA
jgi:hypothetical protein